MAGGDGGGGVKLVVEQPGEVKSSDRLKSSEVNDPLTLTDPGFSLWQ